MVVPHHDFVKAQRSEVFQKVAGKIAPPKTIILVSPNHYEAGRDTMQTTKQEWQISDGTITPDLAVIEELIKNGVSEEAKSFNDEHGIRLLLGDIKQHFPKASLVPIIFKMKTSKEDVAKLHDILKSSCDDCLLIASVDFSHYQPALLANLHDALSERALKNLDQDTLFTKAEVDSPACLALLVAWAGSHNTPKFVLDKHTNSGEIIKNPDSIETTTHIFGWYETGEKSLADNSVSFLIGGDMMFGRMIAHTFLTDGLWKSLDKLGERAFWGTDAGIINLEGPVSETPVPDDIRSNNLIFNFPPETIAALRYLRVNVASLANNHSLNQSQKGLETTQKLLDKASITPIGGPGSSDLDKIATFQGQNLTLHVIGVHTLASSPDLKPLIQKLKEDPKSRVLVFPHWGAEYIYKHGQSQEAQAHRWIDAGADIVIGAHPHVIQDSELYKGKPIIYSLGNLLFDQTFSKETQQGLLIAGEFTDKGLSLFALPIQSVKYKPTLMQGENKKQILDQIYQPFTAQKQTTPAGDVLLFPNLSQ